MTTRERATRVMKAVHDDAMRASPMRWVVGLAFLGYAVYRVESHEHAAGDRVEHIITGVAFLFGAYFIPYGKGFFDAVLRWLPFGPKNGNGGSGGGGTLSGRNS